MKHKLLKLISKFLLTTTATISLISVASIAQAQQRACIVDDNTWQIHCGRLATYEEMNQYQYPSQTQHRYPVQPEPHYQQDSRYSEPNYRPTPVPLPSYKPAPVIVPSPAPKTDVWHQNNQVLVPAPIYERKTERSADRRDPNESATGISDQDLGVAVNRIYQEVLGRNADSSGLNVHIGQLRKGKSSADIRAALASSAEAKQAINRQYNQVLGRNGDAAGLNLYQQKLIAGASLADIRKILADSDEGRRRR